MEKVRIEKYPSREIVVDCAAQFNPEKLKLTKKASWKTEKNWKSNIGNTTFTGGNPISLSVDLFFDTTTTGADVRRYTDPLMGLTLVDVAKASRMPTKEEAKEKLDEKKKQLEEQKKKIEESEKRVRAYEDNITFYTTYRFYWRNERENVLWPAQRKKEELEKQIEDLERQSKGRGAGSMGAPPKCKFVWGSFSFIAIVESVNVTFTMFLPDGTPVRARAKIKMKQIEEQALYAPQNPTTRSTPRKTWVVQEGQRLDWIAYQEYGDPALWRYIAQVNGLDDPHDLRPGQVLDLVQ